MKNGFYQDNIYKIWFKNDKEHRINSPSYININPQYRSWCENDNIHRIYGPAVVNNDQVQWWINEHNITDQLNDYCRSHNINIDDYQNISKSDKLKLKIKFGLIL